MPVLSITVTSEVIQHANDIIQKGGGYLVLAHREGRWELLPKAIALLDMAAPTIRHVKLGPLVIGEDE